MKRTSLSLVVALLCTGCCKRPPVNVENVDLLIPLEKKEVNVVPKKKRKTSVKKEWLKECSVMFSDELDCSNDMKKIASSLGLSINIDKEIRINYKAKKKKFIDILLDICHQLDFKIILNGLNANIEKESVYLHNFYLGNLSSYITTEFSTSVDHSFGNISKDNISKNLYRNSNNYYEIIEKNLTSILPKDCTFTINAQAGVITIIAHQKHQKKVSMYLNSIKKRLNDQVLVEAKLLEIELFDEYSFGIDLEKMKGDLCKNFAENFLDNSFNKNVITFSSKVGGAVLQNFILSYLSKYGRASSISNPYLLISNNNVGVFKAIENKIYFKFKSETILGTGGNGPGATSKYSEFVTYPVGVTFSVHVVKLENDLIKLYIKPTVTEVSHEVEDASYKFVSSGGSGNSPKIPIIKTREMESVLVLRDGQYAIIGGLIDSMSKKETRTLKYSKNVKRNELIILLKVQSIENDDEEDVYNFLFEG